MTNIIFNINHLKPYEKMFELLLLTGILTSICMAVKARLAHLEYKDTLHNINPPVKGSYPPVGRDQRN
jgi:hypothetical protein